MLGLLLVTIGIGAAHAANTGWSSTTQTVTGKAQFAGDRMFYSRNDNHGGFRIRGGIPDRVHYDPAMVIVYDAQIQTCQRNVLADDCTSWRTYDNPYR